MRVLWGKGVPLTIPCGTLSERLILNLLTSWNHFSWLSIIRACRVRFGWHWVWQLSHVFCVFVRKRGNPYHPMWYSKWTSDTESVDNWNHFSWLSIIRACRERFVRHWVWQLCHNFAYFVISCVFYEEKGVPLTIQWYSKWTSDTESVDKMASFLMTKHHSRL